MISIPIAVLLELFADGLNGNAPARQAMKRASKPAGAPGGYAYRAAVPASRPAADYTPRIIPRFEGIAVPLEDARILWQR